jgi:hypothetical protein
MLETVRAKLERRESAKTRVLCAASWMAERDSQRREQFAVTIDETETEDGMPERQEKSRNRFLSQCRPHSNWQVEGDVPRAKNEAVLVASESEAASSGGKQSSTGLGIDQGWDGSLSF